MAHHTVEDRENLENVTATASPLPSGAHRITNSIDFLTGVPIGFFDHGLPSAITQGEGYQTGISDDIQRQINEGLALQQAQHEEKMAEELAEELAENLESEVPDSVESALVDASQNMSLIDRIVQGAMARFGPTAGIRALNELFSILPGTGRITGGIEGLLDLGDEWVGDLASRNLFSRAIDRLAPAERAGRGAIESVENRYSKIVDPIKMGMEWIRIMQNPLAEVAGMAFEGKPNAQRLVRSALTPPPPEMAQGGAVNYNNPLMMRRGGSTRRRSGRRGGVADLLEQQRRARQRKESRRNRQIAQARRRQQQRTPAAPPLEQQTRLSDNYAAIEQRLLAEQAARDSRPPHSPTDGLRDAAISRYQKMLDMEEDLAGGPLLGVPTPVTGGDQIRFGPDGQMLPPLTTPNTPNRNKARPEHFQPGGRLYGRQIRRGPPMIVGKRAPSDAKANIPAPQQDAFQQRPAPQRDAFQQMPASQRDALQQMLDLLAENERLLNRNPIRNIGPDRAESFRRGGAIDPFAGYRARRR